MKILVGGAAPRGMQGLARHDFQLRLTQAHRLHTTKGETQKSLLVHAPGSVIAISSRRVRVACQKHQAARMLGVTAINSA